MNMEKHYGPLNEEFLLCIEQFWQFGLPKDYKKRLGASMGMELLQGLTDDIGGNFSIETNKGTCIKIIFQHKSVITSEISIS